MTQADPPADLSDDTPSLAPAADLLAFTPVPRQRMRRGGWSADRQRQFIALLAETGSVRAACRRLGVGEHHIYKLRNHPEAAGFRAAWEAALDCGIARIEDTLMDRALNGIETPVFYHGEKVGTRQVYNDRLLMFLLNNRAPGRFARGNNGQITGLARNGPSPAQLARLKAQWRKEWEAEQPDVTPEEVRASIDRKIEDIRRRIERERPRRRAVLSEETLAAFAHFAQLRDRDLAAQNADERTVQLVKAGLGTPTTHFDPPERLRLVGPEKKPEQNGDWQGPPEGWRAKKPAPPPETVWTLKDDGFEP